jgi:hypothetical protein
MLGRDVHESQHDLSVPSTAAKNEPPQFQIADRVNKTLYGVSGMPFGQPR